MVPIGALGCPVDGVLASEYNQAFTSITLANPRDSVKEGHSVNRRYIAHTFNDTTGAVLASDIHQDTAPILHEPVERLEPQLFYASTCGHHG